MRIKLNKNLFINFFKISLAIYLLIFLCCFINAEQEYTLTIQASDGAIVISGERESLKKLKIALKELTAKKLKREDIKEFIKNTSIEGIKQIEEFRLYRPIELLFTGGTRKELYTVRQAEIEGIIPLVEGLSENEAIKLLESLNFFPIRKKNFEKMDSLSIAKIIFLEKKKIIVFSNFNESETIYLLY